MRRLVLGIAVAVTSLLPVMGMADDQQIADYIKSRLQAEQQAGNLRGFNVDMRVERGTVWFKGRVSNSAQEMTILRSAQAAGHLGVVKVVDDINVQQAAQTYQNAGYAQPQAAPAPQNTQPPQAAPAPQNTQPPQAAPAPQNTQPPQAAPAPQNIQPPQAAPAPQYTQQPTPYRQVSAQDKGGAVEGIVTGEPLAFASSGAPQAMPASYGTATSGAPNLPGYAWPTTAAYPNYGALAYPQQYSPSAWPYIGPFYPYPQVPLGWRKVSLEWDDGWWMLDFHDK